MSSRSARSEPILRPAPSGTPTRRPAAVPALHDSELLAVQRAGDARVLHDRVRPQVDRTVRRMLGPGDVDRDDVAQQALLEIVSTIHRYRGDCSLDHWTSMITARLIYKHIRRRKFERRVFGPLDAGLLARTRSTSRAVREATLRSTARRALAHLDAMDDGKASAFLLHDVCGYDLREIAEIADVSVAAAQARLVRGRREVHVRIASDPELAYALDSTEAEL
jgi:RNA polymerase sigma-70 factor (ECF subfamily)